jgi:hypothetical protein
MVRRAVLVTSLVTCASCTYDIPDLAEGGGASSDASTEAGADDSTSATDDGGGQQDSASHADGSCHGVLCPCAAATDCASHVCAQSSAQSMTVGSDLLQAAGLAGFCTTTCCTSSDCPTGTVCFASGYGGNYCVSPSWLKRATPASNALGGAACSTGSECRSGLCSGSTCADTCCDFTGAGTECAGGRSCTFGTFPGASPVDTHSAPFCEPLGGSGAYGSPCSQSSQCQGGLCYPSTTGPYFCTQPCRSDTCGSGNSCQFDGDGTDVVFACFGLNATQNVPSGIACVDYQECIGAICNNSSCTNVCFTDADCDPQLPHCTPQETSFYGQSPNVWITMCTP